jgi:hypothetical protein
LGGRRQKAGGRRQEAGGRRQEAEGRRQETGGRRQEAGEYGSDKEFLNKKISNFYCGVGVWSALGYRLIQFS